MDFKTDELKEIMRSALDEYRTQCGTEYANLFGNAELTIVPITTALKYYHQHVLAKD